jgi:hypothetical protein
LSYATYVLRVLSQETLETNKEVKDPSVPGPSLAKEVKDSSLTILFSPDSIQELFVQAGRSLKGFSSRLGAPVEEKVFDLL